MNIAIFTDSFLPGVGGTENAVLGFADALVESGNNVFVAQNLIDNIKILLNLMLLEQKVLK